jgi:hypothetical protein
VNLEFRIEALRSLLSDVSTVLEMSPNPLDRNLAAMLDNWMAELRGFRAAVEMANVAGCAVIEGGRRPHPPDQIEPEHAPVV